MVLTRLTTPTVAGNKPLFRVVQGPCECPVTLYTPHVHMYTLDMHAYTRVCCFATAELVL